MGDQPKREPAEKTWGELSLLQWLQQAVQTTRTGITIADTEGRIIFTNPAEAEMHGYRVDELVGRNVQIFSLPENRAPLTPEALSHVGTWQRESVNVRKDGSRFPVHLVSNTVTDAEGRPIGIVTTSTDITEQKQVEQALRNSEARFRALFEATPVGAVIAGADRRFTEADRAFQEMLGYSEEELREKTMEDITHPEDVERSRELAQKLRRGEIDSFRLEKRYLSKEGRPIWCDTAVAAVRDENGGFLYSIATAVNITDRKRFEAELKQAHDELERRVAKRTEQLARTNEELRHSNAILKAQHDAANSGILVIDSEGRIVSFNRRFLELWGIPEEVAARGRDSDLLDYVHDQLLDWDGFISLVRYLYDHPEEEQSGTLIELKSGRVFSRTTKPVRLPDGRISGRIWDFIDITEQRRAEDARARHVELQNLITGISTNFINLPSERIDAGIRSALEAVGKFADVDRSYVFLLGEDPRRMSNTHEWCSPGTSPEMDALQDVPVNTFPWFWEQIAGGDVVHVPRVASIPAQAVAERTEWERQSIRSLVCVPMMRAGTVVGFIGFDSVRVEKCWGDEVISLLRLVGEIFANALARKQAEKALAESESKYRTLFEGATDAVVILSGEELVDYNAAAVDLFGAKSREEIIGLHPARDFSPPRQPDGSDSMEAANRHIEQAFKAGAARFEWTHRTLQGLVFPAEVSLTAIDLGGERVLQGVVRDLTERKRVEGELRRRDALLEGVARATDRLLRNPDLSEAIDEAISVLGRAAGVDRVYVFEQHAHPDPKVTVPAVSQRYEWCAPGVESQWHSPANTNFPTNMGEELGWYDTLASGEPFAAVIGDLPDYLRPLFEDQGVKTAILVPVFVEEKLWGMIGFDDCTSERTWSESETSLLMAMAASLGGAIERKHEQEEHFALERKLLETQKLESLGVLAGGIAHDFNNLLMAILGNASLARMELPEGSAAAETIERIEIASRRAGELTQQLLAYSGKGRFVVGPVNMNDIIEEMTHLLRVSISKKAVLRYDLASELPSVDADATQLRQIVMNLIVNASDALGESAGVITVSTGTAHVDDDYMRQAYFATQIKEGDYVFLEVSDTGHGMDEETLRKIFEPFFTTKFTGRGLGLAAVLGIVRGHGGALQVYSEVGQGTTFKILFPASDEKAQAKRAPRAQVRPLHYGGKVLVIDDEADVREVTSRMLVKLGFTPLLAADGEEGVRLVQRHGKELTCILLDMTMPRLSGADTFRRIREVLPDARVVLSSGYNEQDAISRFTGEGLAGFIQKPYTPERLAEKLREVFGGEADG